LAVSYVLGRPRPAERPRLNEAILRARDAVLCWLQFGLDPAMNEFNRAPDGTRETDGAGS
jgi:peptidyl-tRNA hydrolase